MSGRTTAELRAAIEAAAATVDRWWKDAGWFAYAEDVDARVAIAQDFMRRALRALDMPQGDKRDAVVKALVDGMLAQVNSPPLRWTDPVRETVETVRETATEVVETAATWGSFGAGAALVLVGIAWLLMKRGGR